MHRRLVPALILAQLLASAEDWGAPMNGLRVSLSVDDKNVVVTFKNVHENREIFLPLGETVGVGRANLINLHQILADADRRQLQYIGGSGVATGRILPYIVPMMAGSTYSVQTPLASWRVGNPMRRIDEELSRGATLQASIAVAESAQWRYVDCYGLRMFWSGRALSNVFRVGSGRR
jgi:hypothetical protein